MHMQGAGCDRAVDLRYNDDTRKGALSTEKWHRETGRLPGPRFPFADAITSRDGVPLGPLGRDRRRAQPIDPQGLQRLLVGRLGDREDPRGGPSSRRAFCSGSNSSEVKGFQ